MIRGLIIKLAAKPIARAINFYQFIMDRNQVIAALHAAHRVHEKQREHIARLQEEVQQQTIARAQAESDLAKFRGEGEEDRSA